MKTLKILFSTLLIAVTAFSASAQSSKQSASRRAHNAAHQELLAGSKARIDKSVITDLVKDVIARENINTLSSESSKLIDDLLAEGRSHIGKRYVHGAKGPGAFDCSGFTSYVYKQFGYNISPSSRAQYTEGTSVARNELRKGDLVFFTSRNSGGAVGHVGIVVSADNETGNFKFIHASIRGVKISDFEGYYVPRYIGAKRIIEK
ncbi:MAG: C40 family peptidase [Muribaculaceae bacterium]|nr:C40 family peptidase [Muribaculaceae bacterium]MDE6559720.1 C40 family peptidase [Muribaculaceae bacterium]